MTENFSTEAVDTTSTDPAHSSYDNSPAEPVEEGVATFAATTDPSTATTPNDPTPDTETIPDAEATFGGVPADVPSPDPVVLVNTDGSAADSPSTVVDPVKSGYEEEARIAAEFSTENTPLEVKEAVDYDDREAFDITDREILDFIHENLKTLVDDVNSLKTLVAEVGPVVNSLVEEAKEKGLSGLLPLLMTSFRK